MVRAIPELELPVQAFVVGTAIGMAAALIQYRRTGDIERWPVTVAYSALAAFGIGALIVILAALT